MTEARLMPYCFGVGDHRAVIIDITEQSIYGDQTFKIVRPNARRLQWKLPQSVEVYGSRLIKKMDEQGLFERMEKIYADATIPLSQKQQKKLNGVDDVMRQLMINAEKKCRHTYMGEVPFSEEYALSARRRQTYKKLIKKCQGLWNHDWEIQNILTQAKDNGITNAEHMSLEKAIKRFKISRQRTKELKKHAPTMRQKFQSELIEEAERNHDYKK
jgi:hypothetical protein